MAAPGWGSLCGCFLAFLCVCDVNLCIQGGAREAMGFVSVGRGP